MRRRSTCPSVAGLRPRLESTIAFSTALTIDLSQTCTESSRGSGTLMVASWLSGMWRAVGFDLHRLQHRGRGAAGAQAAEFMLERLGGALHAALQFVDVEITRGHNALPS